MHLVGRDIELRVVSEQAAHAAQGNPRVVVLEGPAGVGKSALASAVVERLDGWTTVESHQVPSDRANRLSVLKRLAGETVLEVDTTEPALTARSARELIEESTTPICLIIEDAQWVDVDSAQSLVQLLRQSSRLPLLVILTLRPGAEGLDDLARLARAPEGGAWLTISPLGSDSALALLTDRLGFTPDPRALRRILDVTGGYPLYLEELAHRLTVSRDPSDTLTTTLSRLRHDTPERMVTERVAEAVASSSPEVAAALLAVCLGEELTWEELGAVVRHRGFPEPRLRDVLASGLVVRLTSDALRPRHAVLGQAVLDEATPDDVRATHSALGAVLTGTPSLRHRVSAARSVDDDPELVGQLEHRSLEHLIFGEGEQSFELALAAARLDPSRLMAAALTALRVRRSDLVREMRRDVVAEHDPVAHLILSALLCAADQDLPEAISMLSRVDPAACDDDSLMVLAHTTQEVSRLAVAEARYQVAAASCRVSQELARRRDTATASGTPGDGVREHSVLIGLLGLWGHLAELDPQDGTSILAALAELEPQVEAWPGTEPAVAAIRAVRCTIMEYSGLYDEAGTLLATLVDAPITDSDFILQIAYPRFRLLFQSGRWDEARLVAQAALGRTMDRLNDYGRLRLLAAATAVAACRAEEHQPLSLVAVPQAGQVIVRAAQAVTEAWQAVATGGDLSASARALDGAWGEGHGGVYVGIPTAILRVRGHLAHGDVASAQVAVDETHHDSYDPDALAYVRAHMGALMLTTTDPEAARQEFARASDLLTCTLAQNPKHGLHLYRAVLAEDRAQHLLRHGLGGFDEVRDDLAEAVQTTHRAGAPMWRQRLVELGHRLEEGGATTPEPPQLSAGGQALRMVPAVDDSLDSLTSRERELAWLVADGLTNREIAAKLFLSVRTVEYHISNTLKKLHLTSRVDLRQRVRAVRESSQHQAS